MARFAKSAVPNFITIIRISLNLTRARDYAGIAGRIVSLFLLHGCPRQAGCSPMDKGTQNALTLVRLPSGGYVVQGAFQPDRFNSQHFACTTIDEALKFMRDAIFPIGPSQESDANG